MSIVLNIGIDFGATHTGVSILAPDQSKNFAVKRPTIIMQNVKSSTLAYIKPLSSEADVWKSLEHFKLGLMTFGDWAKKTKDDTLLSYARKLIETTNSVHQPTVIVAVFLKQFWDELFGEYCTRNVLAPCLLEGNVTFTYPAVWSSAAVDDFKQAVVDAGLFDKKWKLAFMKEHVAAARGILSIKRFQWYHSRKRPVVVVDCGGMTTDGSIGYFNKKGASLSYEDFLHESCMTGSISVDAGIEKLLTEALEAMAQEKSNMDFDEQRKLLLEVCRRQLKPPINFLSLHNTAFEFKVAGESLGTETKNFRKVYQDLVDRIANLVQRLYNRVDSKIHHLLPNKVFLTGGLSKGEQLQTSLQQKLSERGLRLEVTLVGTGKERWTAVARGAAWNGKLDSRVVEEG
ncbi:hypothetical protein S40293_07371 [Stachybotrys chartarum IBT 40293]|nr:hypothetical protein S40293_07371 [Stachybotrys chartarum IBT 40293]